MKDYDSDNDSFARGGHADDSDTIKKSKHGPCCNRRLAPNRLCLALQLMVPPSVVSLVVGSYLVAASNHRRISRDGFIFPALSVLPVVYSLYYLGHVAFKNFCGHEHPPMVALISLTIAQMVHLAVLLVRGSEPGDWIVWTIVTVSVLAAMVYTHCTTSIQSTQPHFHVELDDNGSLCCHENDESLEIGRNALVASKIV
ncbi:hypothetical protein IV203_024319 [Nitzschia inconspicua]|uniref:Uncharacterized protein n=1 Tax=Nitzschia inconspicua TaxID=303405 RepID=A0A9K3KCE2_9STRA|nr:hypothetical protein IV203_024319 [Nitzschia inconspicua]